MGVAVFDVCDTLYATNTTVGFLRFLGARGHRQIDRTVARWANRRHPLFWLGAAVQRLTGHDLARDRMIRSLAGLKRAVLDNEADIYVATVLAEQRNERLFEHLDEHARADDALWLASNSLAPVVTAIARMVGADCVASELAFVDDVCHGSLSVDLTGRKAEVMRVQLGDHEHPLVVYTDNRSDADLIMMADRAVVVVPKGRRVEAWAGAQHEYLAV